MVVRNVVGAIAYPECSMRGAWQTFEVTVS